EILIKLKSISFFENWVLAQDFCSLISHRDPDVIARTKALGAISSLIRDNKPGVAAFRLANGYGALRILVQYLLQENSSDCNELSAVMEESQLIDLLWSVCYNEPSSLREKGLLDLPGEDAPHQMPSLLALAPDTKSATGKKKDKKEEPLLILGLGPPSSHNR
ncbi:hypothetical protein MKW94_011393, partial [Papaver nudicaule]|nr:hypothetical protein [Papaver nudicaule]